MSHWIILPLGAVEQPLTEAYSDLHLDRDTWVKKTAEAIKQLGDHNPSNGGFILLKEHSHKTGLSALLLPTSIDWEAHNAVKNHHAMRKIETENPVRFKRLQGIGDQIIRDALTNTIHYQLHMLAEKLTGNPSYKLANLSADEQLVVDHLIVVAERLSPPLVSFFQLFIEDRLHCVLGPMNEQLRAFHALPSERQLLARHGMAEVLGWEAIFPAICGTAPQNGSDTRGKH